MARPAPATTWTAMTELIAPIRFARSDRGTVEWVRAESEQPYLESVAAMEARAAAIAHGAAVELAWLLEHPSLYTSGVSARPRCLIAPDRFPVFQDRSRG